jgi:hypothetical protein
LVTRVAAAFGALFELLDDAAFGEIFFFSATFDPPPSRYPGPAGRFTTPGSWAPDHGTRVPAVTGPSVTVVTRLEVTGVTRWM